MTDSPEDAEVILQKLPSDMGIHRNPRKGTLNAPEKILDGVDFDSEVLVDEVFPDEFDLEETHRRIEENTRDLSGYGKTLVSMGGDHSVSYPVIKALKQDYPGMQLVWLDAHLDIKKKVDGHVSHDVVVRQLVEEEVFQPKEVFFVGITRVDSDEEQYLEEKDFNIYRAGEIVQFIREFDIGEQPVYLSIDIDAMEGIEGTGYRDGELSEEDVEELVKVLDFTHCDLVEVAPSLGEGETLDKACNILEELVDSGTN